MSILQEKLCSANQVCQSTSEQNLQLQLSLQQQQTMLTESTAHISELEESQNQLQTLVSERLFILASQSPALIHLRQQMNVGGSEIFN